MNLMAGFEDFGFTADKEFDILATEKKETKASETEAAAPVEIKEEDLLIDKKIKCPVCDGVINAKIVKSRVKKLESDEDLRPNAEGIDTLKYDVIACNKCGYAALASGFNQLSSAHMKLIRENVTPKFKPRTESKEATYSYDYAIDRAKMALVTSMAKRGKLSEKSYICLKIAWMRRGQLASVPNDEAHKPFRELLQKEYDGFYKQAYEGFKRALETESPPYCGMNSTSVELITAVMAKNFKEYDTAIKLLGRIITSPGTTSRVKDKCLDLKDEITKLKQAQS